MPIIIAVMGITGVGKSFFIKAAGACQPDTGGVPVIGTIDTDLFHIPGTNINLMDTPGFDDTFSNDSDILSRIANCLANFHNERIPVSGILYLHPIDQPRMKGSDMKNLEVFREIVGKRNIANCFFVTTKWSKVSDEEGALREQELVEDGSFWKLMLDQGAQVMRFRGTRRSATEIIHSLCSAVDPLGFKPKITIEYCEEGRSINETSAG
ncbi:putative GTPase Era, partial [Acephala macrosclerotiorum]